MLMSSKIYAYRNLFNDTVSNSRLYSIKWLDDDDDDDDDNDEYQI
jgi:hypothetical protein